MGLDRLVSPCTYQGGKQRVAKEIIDKIYDEFTVDDNTYFYDLCCGSGAVSLELLNHGFNSSKLVMLDKGLYGLFWKGLSDGTFDSERFKHYCDRIPSDLSLVKGFMEDLSREPIDDDLVYRYLLLQSAAFGGKQIWLEGNKWHNKSFRSFWQPTETSKRRSVVNPMMPGVSELERRVKNLTERMSGKFTAYNDDISLVLSDEFIIHDNSIIYIDPPYSGTTKYGFSFDYMEFIKKLQSRADIHIVVSEKEKLSGVNKAYQLNFNSSKGGISGNKKVTQEEWFNIFQ